MIERPDHLPTMTELNAAGHQSRDSGIAMTILATVAVILRLLTRFRSNASFGADDFFAVSALMAMYAWFSVMLWGLISGGGGANIKSIADEYNVFQAFLKSLYTLNAVYALAITCVKLSILFLYRRIFTTPRFLKASLGIVIIVIIWWIVFTICTLLPCLPPQKFWHPELSGPCYNYDLFFLGSEIVGIILDLIILTLPVRMISTLQLSQRRKWILYCIFLVGGGVCVTGIVRLILTYVPHSVNISFTQAELWTNIHLGIAIICACLPTYRLLFKGIFNAGSGIWSCLSYIFTSRALRATKKDHNNSFHMNSYQHDQNHYNHLDDPLGEHQYFNHVVAATASSIKSHESDQDRSRELNSIVVRNTVDVV